jgi:hypothetical protein
MWCVELPKVFQQGKDLHHVVGVKLRPIYIHAFAAVKPETIGLISPEASLTSKISTGRQSAILLQPETCIITLDQHVNEVKGIYAMLFLGGKALC